DDSLANFWRSLRVLLQRRGAVAQEGEGGIDFAALATLNHDPDDLPWVVRRLEEVTPVSESVSDLHQIPCEQLFQANAHIRSGDPKGLGDLIRVQRVGREPQQRMDLRHRPVDPPATTHLAPVDYVALHDRSESHTTYSVISVITEIID